MDFNSNKNEMFNSSKTKTDSANDDGSKSSSQKPETTSTTTEVNSGTNEVTSDCKYGDEFINQFLKMPGETSSDDAKQSDSSTLSAYERMKKELLEAPLSSSDSDDGILADGNILDLTNTLPLINLSAQALSSSGNGVTDSNFSVSTVNAESQNKLPGTTESAPWHDVGIFKGTSCTVRDFFSSSKTNEHVDLRTDNLPDYTFRPKTNLEPGTAYKVRIAAINSCGRGEWSDVAAFKTSYPDYPSAPNMIKITKSAEGANLSWSHPSTSPGNIVEYCVCIAVKSTVAAQLESITGKANPPMKLVFALVYCGPDTHTVVCNEALECAYIDKTSKPAMLFRISAKNEKGYGPATQVRWLQDVDKVESVISLSD